MTTTYPDTEQITKSEEMVSISIPLRLREEVKEIVLAIMKDDSPSSVDEAIVIALKDFISLQGAYPLLHRQRLNHTERDLPAHATILALRALR